MITSFIGQNSVPITRTLVLRHNRLCPPGAVSTFAGTLAPDGWLMCNGQEVLISSYNKLYETIGNTYGVASTEEYFKLPDMRSKFPLGSGDGGENLTNRVLASTGGAETHTLTSNEIPSHTHTINDSGHSHTYTIQNGTQNIAAAEGGTTTAAEETTTSATSTTNTTGITINSTGGGQAHNNMPPFIVLNYIIKY
jgi:microcystin-dependent protein